MKHPVRFWIMPLAVMLTVSAWASQPDMDAGLYAKAKKATDAGLHYLKTQQSENGSWSDSVGVTALALRGFLDSYRNYSESDGAVITRPVNFILKHVRKDGSIAESNQHLNYNTAVAIIALAATGNEKYKRIIEDGQSFIKGLQLDESKGYTPDQKYYGNIGYSGSEKPDLSNHYMALEALRMSHLDSGDDVWKKAVVFIQRCQNNSETNDQSWAANDGGFIYSPGFSPHGGTASYGSMTHAGLISLLFAGVDRKDPRIQAANKWIRAHYTLEDNPGAKNSQALYYYYMTFAKSMKAYGDDIVVDAQGRKHNWRNDLVRKLLALQEEDGSWVNHHSSRWWEGDKNLVTAYSLIALDLALSDQGVSD